MDENTYNKYPLIPIEQFTYLFETKTLFAHHSDLYDFLENKKLPMYIRIRGKAELLFEHVKNHTHNGEFSHYEYKSMDKVYTVNIFND